MDKMVLETRAATEEDVLRIHPYRLLARYLAGPPDDELLGLTVGLEGDETEFGGALRSLARAAAGTSPGEAAAEYHELFIGIGRGELVPYASYYLTGFLNERPLAVLRGDLARLGVARAERNRDPEDHIASLCEVMAGLIAGEFGDGSLATQEAFFRRHLAPWASRFFADLERARAARLYAPVGTLGRLFMDIEETGFAMAA